MRSRQGNVFRGLTVAKLNSHSCGFFMPPVQSAYRQLRLFTFSFNSTALWPDSVAGMVYR